MADKNWKQKKSETRKNEGQVTSSLEVLKNYRKRSRVESVQEEKRERMNSLKMEWEALGDARHNIRKKRVLMQQYKDIEKELEKGTRHTSLMEAVLESQKNKKVKKKLKRSITEEDKQELFDMIQGASDDE